MLSPPNKADYYNKYLKMKENKVTANLGYFSLY